MKRRIQADLALRARDQRRHPTKAEQRLWSCLRRRQVKGTKFRRQHPLAPYIVDFCCLDLLIVIEIDGGQHFTLEGETYDRIRSQELQRHGYHILRFTNNDVLDRLDDVLNNIHDTIRNHSS